MGADQGAECETIAERECKIANVDAITALGGFGTPSERESERERESARLIRVSSPVQDEHEQVLAYQRSRNSLTSSLVACGVPILYFCTWRIMLPTSVNITSALPSTMSAVASAPISTPKS